MYAFVCLVPVRLLLSSMGVLYHLNGELQRTYLTYPVISVSTISYGGRKKLHSFLKIIVASYDSHDSSALQHHV